MLYRRISHLTCKSSNFQDNVGSNVSHCALRPNWLPAGIQKKFLVWCDVLQSYQHSSWCWQQGVLVAFRVLCEPALLTGILVKELLLHLFGFRNLTLWAGRRLEES